MIKSYKIRLIPTKEQEDLMNKSINVSRWAYNYGLEKSIKHYEQYKTKINFRDVRKEISDIKKTEEYNWINEVSAKVYDQALIDLDLAFKNFFKGRSFPRFKTKKSKKSFFVRSDSVWFKKQYVRLEKIGFVEYRSNYEFKKGGKIEKFSNARCFFDGKYWYLGFGKEFDENQVELKEDLTIGIDLGIKELAVCSNGKVFKNINKTSKIKRLDKKLKFLKRRLSKKQNLNTGNKFNKNIDKLHTKIKLVYRKMTNIRQNHIHQTTRAIINENPSKIVIEDLDVKSMVKNKRMAKLIMEQKFYEFRRQIEYKAKMNGIIVIVANRWFPSSKKCSCCGNVKKSIGLNERVYVCEKCGLEIDRDLNASINLSKYEMSL